MGSGQSFAASVVLPVVIVSTGCLVSACSPSSSGQAATSTGRTTTSTLPPVCQESQLDVSIPRIDRGAGMVGTTIQFQNMSPSTCSLSGYPMVMLVDGAGHTLLSATEETSSATLAPAILLPTQKATARLDSDAVQTNFSVPCVSTTTLSVTPPGSTRPLSVDDDHAQGLAGSIDACDGATIEPVQAQSIPGKRTPLPCPGGTLYVIPGRVISDAKYKGIVVMLQNDSGWN
ncbi:MAG TPA: hypothetical protein DCQ30_13940, partial [Acidimicrobiaceae bacterium]|nr:hypothetical protein [Acidimicrobiaceae bacterium]